MHQADFCFFKSPPLLFQGSQFPTYLFIPLILSSVYFLHSPLLSFLLLFFSLSLSLFCPISCFPHQGGREAILSILIVIFLALSKSCLKNKEVFWYQERTTFLKTECVTLFQFFVGIANFITRIYMDPLFSQQFFNGYNLNNKIVKTVFVQRSSKK